jgi:hypothetical protein
MYRTECLLLYSIYFWVSYTLNNHLFPEITIYIFLILANSL